jgi:hypothetical protein
MCGPSHAVDRRIDPSTIGETRRRPHAGIDHASGAAITGAPEPAPVARVRPGIEAAPPSRPQVRSPGATEGPIADRFSDASTRSQGERSTGIAAGHDRHRELQVSWR